MFSSIDSKGEIKPKIPKDKQVHSSPTVQHLKYNQYNISSRILWTELFGFLNK